MAGGSKGKKKIAKAGRKKEDEGKKGSKGKKQGARVVKKEGRGKARYQGDVFSEAAMENAYYICHNVQDLLKVRGFPWPGAQKKKKKGKGGKRK